MNVVFLSPVYPAEMAEYTRGLAEVGANVFGVGDAPVQSLSPQLRGYLADYLQVPGLLDEDDIVRRVTAWMKGRHIDRIESQWEPLVIAAARLREVFGVAGMSVDTIMGFRDKQLMKERIAAAGLRVPHAARCRTAADVRAAVERIGYPVIIKPIAGAGSADTYRVNNGHELDGVLARTQHVGEVSCEEFVEGEEFTFDTVSIQGRPAYINVAQYLPRPLLARQNEWISPIICTIRNLGQPYLREGIELGMKVLGALNMGTGFTHMEWYRKADGEVVFGEIGCRPGGANLVEQMNYTSDIDLYREWARAVCWHSFEADTYRKYNTAIIFKRAQGEGVIQGISGLDEFKQRYGGWICADTLLRPGQHRRNWKNTLVSDGFVMVRHPEWEGAMAMARDAASQIGMYAS
jgi:hypothetical protein